jgi:predicted nucleotidyltransferase
MNKTTDAVDKSTKEKIIAIISALIPQAKIYLFGSRARNKYSQSSDIDIAIDAGKLLRRAEVDELVSIFSASNIRERIDVVDFHQVSEDMRDSIKQEGILWKS